MYYMAPHNGLDRSKQAPRLFPEIHTLPSAPGSATGGGSELDVAAAHEFLTSTPMDNDYSSGWPSGVDVDGITKQGGVTTIALTGSADLGDKPAPHPYSPYRELAVQALLATANVQGQANFTYNGEPLRWLFYEPASGARKPEQEVRAWVSITSPADGATVSSPVTVEGSANVFEANVNWQLLNAGGQIVDSGYTMAGTMEWKPFSIRLGTLQPGTYTIRAYEASPKNGKPTYVDDKTFTVS
jgi:Immunoglobulin-like domain of bacterial spore germination